MCSRYSDSFNFLSKLTLRKVLNATKVISSFYLSKWAKKPVQWGKPLSVAIEPTTACNLSCPECPSGLKQFSRETGKLNESFYKEILQQLSKDLCCLTFYFQGEPYLHPEFLEMVKYASRKKVYTATSTNAHFLTDEVAKNTVESGLDRLTISIDGTTQGTYESYRVNGSLEKVIAGTKNILKWKKELKSKTPFVIFQFLVVKPNEHQTAEVMKLGKTLGVDEVRLKTAQIYDYKNGNELIPENAEFSRYSKQSNGTYTIKNKMQNHCWRMWHSCVITWDGLVVPCCFDKDAQHRMGDLKKNSFVSLWKGGQYNNFRAALLRSRHHADICANCTEGTKVWASH